MPARSAGAAAWPVWPCSRFSSKMAAMAVAPTPAGPRRRVPKGSRHGGRFVRSPAPDNPAPRDMSLGAAETDATAEQTSQNDGNAADARVRMHISVNSPGFLGPPRPGLACPAGESQPDGGEALRRFHDRMACVLGAAIGGHIAEDRAIGHPFCKALARATDDVAGPASISTTSDRIFSYSFLLSEDGDTAKPMVIVYDNPCRDVAVSWHHPVPSKMGGHVVRAQTEDGLKHVYTTSADPKIEDTARSVLDGLRGAWNDYRERRPAEDR